MQSDALLLSVRPMFVARILSGQKTTELRRVRPNVERSQRVLIYSSSPVMAVVASAVVEQVFTDSPAALWLRVRKTAGVSAVEYRAYFTGAARASAICLSSVRALERPIGLSELRQHWPEFRPPQSYRFVGVNFERTHGELRWLSPPKRT